MTQPKNKRQLLKDLPLKDRERVMAPALETDGLMLGESRDAVIEDYRKSIPDSADWHVMTDEDKPEVITSRKARGYEVCKKGQKVVRFKGDIAFRLKKDIYEARQLRKALESTDQGVEKMVQEGDPDVTEGEED